MTLRQGSIVRNGQAMTSLTLATAQTESVSPSTSVVPRGRIVSRERVQAAEQASELLALARERAAQIIDQAEAEAAGIRSEAQKKGVEEGAAKLASAWLVFNKREADADIRALDRSLAIGRLLAERLIGDSLLLDPNIVAGLAREAMHHLWRSKKVTIHAHPTDAVALSRNVATFGMPSERIVIAEDTSRERGSLRFTSEFGELDGELGPQLDRLVEAIRQDLRAD